MFRTLMLGAVSALTLSAAAFAQQGGTEQEARAMLSKAVAAVKADPVVAIAMFIKGEGGFRDRDLYPFCFRISDGKTLASPKAVQAGTDVRSLKDSKGSAYGEAIYAAAQKPEGQITEIPSYMFPKPDTTTPTFEKVSFVTKVGSGLRCRLLQIDHSEPDDLVGRQPMSPSIDKEPAGLRLGGFSIDARRKQLRLAAESTGGGV